MARLPLSLRQKIEDLLKQGNRAPKVAQIIEKHESTVYREIKKCKDFYNAQEAEKNTQHNIKPIDFEIIGKRFGLLVVISYVNKITKHRTYWRCRCDCGRETIVSRKKLADYCSADRPMSCGCIAKESKGPNGKVDFEEASLRKFQDLLSFREINGSHWEWKGYCQRNKNGPLVPKTSWKNKAMSVRKCMWLLMNGQSEEPRSVFLTCDNALCFNPDHLTIARPEKRVIFNKKKFRKLA